MNRRPERGSGAAGVFTATNTTIVPSTTETYCIHGGDPLKCGRCKREASRSTPGKGTFDGRVRDRDPETSWLAADIAEPSLSVLQREILAILVLAPLTDDELYDRYVDAGGRLTPQRIRTARRRLVDEGRIRDTGRTAPSRYKNPATLWAIVP